MNVEYLVETRDFLTNSKQELVCAVLSLEKTDGKGLDTTVKEIKAIIGDLEVSIEVLNRFIRKSVGGR